MIDHPRRRRVRTRRPSMARGAQGCLAVSRHHAFRARRLGSVDHSQRPVPDVRQRRRRPRPRRPLAVHQLPRRVAGTDRVDNRGDRGQTVGDVRRPHPPSAYVGQAPHILACPYPPPNGRGLLHFSEPISDHHHRHKKASHASAASNTEEDAVRQVQALRPRRAPRPHLAERRHRQGTAVVQRRPARRQPGADRPDGSTAQASHVRRPGQDGFQGDRGRLPVGEPARLRLHSSTDRGRPDPRRRHDPGTGAVPTGVDRANLRVPAGRDAGDRALLQLDQSIAARGGVRARHGRHRRHRRERRPAVSQARTDHGPHTDPLRVLPRELHADRAGLRHPDLRGGDGSGRADARAAVDRQPACHGGVLQPQRLRRRDRVVRPHDPQPRRGRDQLAPAQRSRLRCGGRRVRRDGRRRSSRGNAVRQRRAHRQRRHRQPGDEPVQQRRRPRARHHRHRCLAARRRVLQSSAGALRGIRTPAISSTPRSAAATRTPSRRVSRRYPTTTTNGACRTCRSIRSTSAVRTRPSFGSTRSRARVASPT